MRLHTKCILHAAGSRYSFYCATPPGNSSRMRSLPPGIDSSAKGIKSLSISGIPGRRRWRRWRRHSLRLQALNLLRYWRYAGLQTLHRGGIRFIARCYTEAKFDEILCSIVCLLLLIRRNMKRIMVRLDDMTLSLR